MAELEILSMYVLTPMLVEYTSPDTQSRQEQIFLIDPVADRIFWTTGEPVNGPLYEAIMTIVRKQKNPVTFLTEEQVAEMLRKQSEEAAHARKVKS